MEEGAEKNNLHFVNFPTEGLEWSGTNGLREKMYHMIQSGHFLGCMIK